MIEKCFIDYKCRCTCLKVTYRVYVTPAMKNGGIMLNLNLQLNISKYQPLQQLLVLPCHRRQNQRHF